MAGFTNMAEVEILDGIFTGWVGYPSLWVALSTTVPDDDGTGFTEATGVDYARVAVTDSDFAAASAGAPSTRNSSSAISFPVAGGDWSSGSNMVAFGLFDAATGGDLVVVGSVTSPRAILSGDQATFGVGDLTIRLGDPSDF